MAFSIIKVSEGWPWVNSQRVALRGCPKRVSKTLLINLSFFNYIISQVDFFVKTIRNFFSLFLIGVHEHYCGNSWLGKESNLTQPMDTTQYPFLTTLRLMERPLSRHLVCRVESSRFASPFSTQHNILYSITSSLSSQIVTFFIFFCGGNVLGCFVKFFVVWGDLSVR